MNKLLNGEHPSEEQLMDVAVSGGLPEIQEHADNCPSCAGIVREFREVKQRVALLGEEDVPQRIERHILNITHHGHGTGFLQALLSNPFLIALVVAIVVVLLYFLVGSEVFRVP